VSADGRGAQLSVPQQWLRRWIVAWGIGPLLDRYAARDPSAPGRSDLPLIDDAHRLVLLISPKAACTAAVKWFFRGAGVLDEALRMSPWVHDFRIRSFDHRSGARQRLHGVLFDPRYRKVKVVRDPYDRAVSSFLHAARWADHFLPAAPPGFCFEDFLHAVQATPRAARDPHVAEQRSFWEWRWPGVVDELVRAESLAEGLTALSDRLGIDNPFDAAFAESDHLARRQPVSVPAAHRIGFRAILERVPADYADFYQDPAVRALAASIYAADFDAYGYPR
jgi:hypothetical protein